MSELLTGRWKELASEHELEPLLGCELEDASAPSLVFESDC